MPVLQAVLAAVICSLVAWRAGALAPSGAAAAAAVGTLTLIGAGWPGGALLMAFFVPGSAISRLWPGAASPGDGKGDRRDGWQVLANGGFPALVVVIGGPGTLLAFAAGLAAASADTWATAVGAHSPSLPRHLFSGQTVSHGASGGVTALGTLGAAGGAALIAASAAPLVGLGAAAIVFGIGMGGMLLDSALGAGVQGTFHCDHCGERTEHRVHRCGSTTRLRGGFAWMTNDGVNALASLAATTAGWVAWRCCSA